jgi:hypothetical protein
VREPRAETLLEPGTRAALPLARQVRLYLDPFALFKDATRGTALEQRQALGYNRAMRWMLLAYLRRWAVLAAAFLFCLVPLEALGAERGDFILPAAVFAVGFCIAAAVSAYALIAFVLLSTHMPGETYASERCHDARGARRKSGSDHP